MKKKLTIQKTADIIFVSVYIEDNKKKIIHTCKVIYSIPI